MSVFDKQKSRRSFDRAAKQYDHHARLQQQVASTLVSHVVQHPTDLDCYSILDLGCGTGQVTEAMCANYPEANVVALDFSQRMLGEMQKRLGARGFGASAICADAEQLPFQEASFDFVISSLMLQWSNNLLETLTAINKLLKPGGMLAFSSFSQGTLKEVKAGWSRVDGEAHSSDFQSLGVFESIAMAAGYADINVIPQTIVINYASVREMLLEMKGIGASNARNDRLRGLTGKQRFKAFEAAMDQYRLPDGRFPCSWEVTYVICAKPFIKSTP